MLSITQFINEGRKKEEKEKVIEGVSILDKIVNKESDNVEEFVKEFIRPNGPTIYAFVTDKVKDAIKVGYTDQHPEKRIEQWREIYGKELGEVTCIGYWSSEEFNEAGERVFFWDHAIHMKLRNKGYKQLEKDEFMATLTDKGRELVNIHYSREFFDKYKRLLDGKINPEDKEELSGQLIEDIIKLMKANIKAGTADFKLYSFDKEGKTTSQEASKVWKNPDTYSNTKLQEEAIERGVKAVKDGKKNILMAAVMRFGKTHASYEIIKEAGLKRVIVCSAKADVRAAWREDINHKDFYKDFVFIEVLDKYKWDITHLKDDKLVTDHVNVYDDTLDPYKDKTQIFFFTLHDLGGSISEIKDKHKKIFDQEFDLMVVDETHYGSHANTFGRVTKLGREDIEDDNSDIEEEQKIAKESSDALKKLNIKYKSVLQVSGTPYYILASNEMIEEGSEIISKVSYSDMLNARDEWNKEHKNEDPSTSPYFGIPTLHKIGLRLSKKCRKALAESGMTSSLTELFKIEGDKFKYEAAVKELMKSIFGDGRSKTLSFLNNKSVDGNKVCKHTLMVLPRVNACKVMKKLLEEIIDTNERQIFNIVGNNGKTREIKDSDELNKKLYELDNSGKKSIILTVNRFLTGVSLPCVDSMIYLKNAASPQEYDQNIFRLCTRYVKSVKNPDDESRSKKVNMKDNVYLIDFNIANMFNMMANSAKMKAIADGDPTMKTIEKYMKEDLACTPIFCEDKGSNEILGKMQKITSKDLMEIYAGYNKNKSIADIVNDEIDLFGNLFTDKKFQEVICNMEIDGDKSKMNLDINDEGDEEIEIGNDKKVKSLVDKIHDSGITKKDKDELVKLTKEKFKAITKNLLYCNVCLDEPCKDLEEIIKKSKADNDFKNMLGEFKVSLGDLKKAYDIMGTNFKQAYNNLLLRMSMLAQDSSLGGYEKFSNALKGLGRLDKNEVVTPPEIVEKMINKLDKKDYEKANSILLVNEKQAEFFIGIYKKFGKEIAKKCKIVASSEIGKHLCRKMLKSIGLNDYIKYSIININDIDGNGRYDVNDFLKMNNEEILKENNGKKFDICLMNPPYSSTGGNTLHLEFVDKCLELSHNQISIFPIAFVTKITNKSNNKYKENLSKYLLNVEEVSSKQFTDTNMFNIGIYQFSDKKKESDNININLIKSSKTLKTLNEFSNFSDYEQQIVNYLLDNGSQLTVWAGGTYGANKKKLIDNGISDEEEINKLRKQSIIKNCNRIKKDKIYLIVNAANGLGAKFFTSKNGEIIDDYNELINKLIRKNKTSGYNIMHFNTIKEAENCKIALQNPLLRFTCCRTQVDQNMPYNHVYKYIPNINWEDERVKTDEGLLEICGCPKDKCKEYAEYCKKIIDKVDKK